VWDNMKDLAGLSNVMGSITFIVDTLIPVSKRRSARCVIAKLLVAACCYYIWQHAFFTAKDVKAMEELTWDYGIDFDDNSDVKPFHCKRGSRNGRRTKHKNDCKNGITALKE
ncbi:hypothetical protein Tco_1117855, partial [Tanacetum coccineum]